MRSCTAPSPSSAPPSQSVEIENASSTLSQASQSIRWADLSAEEQRGALAFLYRQLEDLAVVSLLDAEGEGVGASVFVEPGAIPADLVSHPTMSLASLQQFARAIPFAAAQEKGSSLGAPFVVPGDRYPLLPIAIRVKGRDDSPWVLAVAISLRPMCNELLRLSAGSVTVYALDTNRQIVCHPLRQSSLAPVEAGLLESLGQGPVMHFVDSSGVAMLAAAKETTLGWAVVAEQAEGLAFKSSRRILLQTLFWLGLSLLVAIVAGVFLAQSIIRPVRELVDGALKFAGGRFGYRLPVHGTDELGRLSETFNKMGAEIEKRDAELRGWNEELQQRVEERTHELKVAQEQLLQSKKIAAVTALGAGVAHEINNPLTSVIGLTQVLKAKMRKEGREAEAGLLAQSEREALRIKDIVKTLASFAETYSGPGFRNVNLNDVVESALKLVEEELLQDGIRTVRRYAEPLPWVQGNPEQLQQVLLNLVSNSRTAMKEGGELTLSTSVIEDKLVKIAITDTGRGIAPDIIDKIFEPFFTTKDDWRGEGLGLTVAYRLVEQHRGRIEAASEVNRGTTMTITLPVASRGAHLV